jgi:DNA-binding response OmpR family regulator
MRGAIVEDDQDEAVILSQRFQLAGHLCHGFVDGWALIRSYNRVVPDAVVLDWNPAESAGPAALSYIRKSGRPSIPVLLMSSARREEEIVRALRLGADDYLVKPVRRFELIARLEAVARRVDKSGHKNATMEVGTIRLDCGTRSVWRDGRVVDVTTKDFDLLFQFLRNIGKLLSRGHLQHAVWGHEANVLSRTLDTHVCRVRAKLGLVPENGWSLSPVYTQGYRLDRLKEVPGNDRGDGPSLPSLHQQRFKTVMNREHFSGRATS